METTPTVVGGPGLSKENAEKLSSIFDDILQKTGRLDGEIVVQEAESSKSPHARVLREYLEWDNDKAGHRFRVIQATNLIRRVRVTFAPDEKPMRTTAKYVHVTTEVGRTRAKITDVMTDAEYRAQALTDCLRQAQALRRKYAFLQELSQFFQQIDTLVASPPPARRTGGRKRTR